MRTRLFHGRILFLACAVLAGVLLAAASGAESELPVPFRVIAHRGASARAPENSLPAFRQALAIGVEEVELDVQLSSDGRVVLFHDDTLERKTSLVGRVRDFNAAELAKADIGSWFDATHPEAKRRYAGTPLITLDGLFEAIGRQLHYHIELKSKDAALPGRVLDAVRRFELSSNVTVTSFHFDLLVRMRALEPAIPIGYLVQELPNLVEPPKARARIDRDAALALQRAELDRAKRAGFDQVGIAIVDLSREIVAEARARGLEIRAWRIRGDQDMERAIALGANGMTTNWPGRLLHRIASGKPLDR